MLNQKEKMKIIRKSQKIMEHACRNLITRRYGSNKTDLYWHKTKERYCR